MTQNSQIFIGQNCHFELHLATDGKPDSFHYVSFSARREKITSVKNKYALFLLLLFVKDC